MITLQILFPLAIIKYMKFLTKGQLKFFLAAHFAKRNTKFGGGESEGGQKGRGLGGRNFCPPSLSAAEFHHKNLNFHY